MTASPTEDKTCRMCGHADQSNLNIFQTRQIHKKILALYPIVLYKSDPLPKNICLKCYGNILTRYDEYFRISKIQAKWINNVKNNQPNNPYIRILDKIEETNKYLIEALRKIGDESLDDSFSIQKHNHSHFPEDILSSSYNRHSQSLSGIKNDKDNFVQRFSNQHSNSILLSHLKRDLNVNNLDFRSNGYPLSKSMNSKFNATSMNYTNFPKNKCRYCFKVLPNQKYLAFHQAKYHLDLVVFKSFTKKILPKRLRCGQPIKINNKTCLRCNNCWKCFDRYDSILNHWQNKHCEFYCLICGKEFSKDPAFLRKHIKIQHALDYKSYQDLVKKGQNYNPITTPRPGSSPQPIKISDQDFKIDENSSSSLIDSKGESSDLLDFTGKPKIPVLKLKRKTNSIKEEFDIKIEEDSSSPTYPRSPNSTGGKSESLFGKPLLRVKDISELQCKPKEEEDEFVNLDELKLNTINLENNSDSVQPPFSDEL